MDTSDPPMIDIVLCMDCTGSMGSYLREAKDAAERISLTLRDKYGHAP